MDDQGHLQSGAPILDFGNHRVLLSQQVFEQGIKEMRRIVGEDYVVIEGDELEQVSRATIPEPKRPSALVRPGNAQEVADIVKISQRCGIPIWPVSSGKNWGYGSATPVLEHTVVVKLDRLNRILEVNDELAYAVIEPGVTYRQLHQFLREHHPGLLSDTTDGPPDGSVIGNALDRGLGVTHYSDHFGTLCGLEVVLPNGDLIRTGGGPNNCPTWNTHKWGVGPYVEGLFSQSNLGIVTKAGVWLMPKPEGFASFTFDLRDERDLPKLIDAVRDLALRNILQSASHIANEVVALSVLAQYPMHLVHSHSRLTPDVLADLCRRYGIHKWTFGGGIQGTSAQVRVVKRELRKRLAGLGKIIFVDDRLATLATSLAQAAKWPVAGKAVAAAVKMVSGKSIAMLAVTPHIHTVLKGTPSDYFVRHAYFKSPLPKPEFSDPDRDNCGLTWFAPVVPMTGERVQEVMGICRPLFEEYDFDFYVALLVQNARSMIVLMSIFFRKEDDDQVARAKRLYLALNEATAKAGFQQYRIGVSGMLRMRDSAPDLTQFLGQIKAGIDPAGILAPGKYGICNEPKAASINSPVAAG